MKALSLTILSIFTLFTACSGNKAATNTPRATAQSTSNPTAESESKETVSKTSAPSYESDIKPIVENFCTTCHAGSNPQAGFVLTDYASVRKMTESGDLLVRINDAEEPMPLGGLMSEENRAIFAKWAKAGYLEKGEGKLKGSPKNYSFTPPQITPVDIQNKGYEFLEMMQGHWVGKMNLMGQEQPWMAFDYRAIAPSQVHGIFEGGSMGNLFTTFFIANFKGTPTIMARNGGILAGIYRTSYFVLDTVEYKDGASYYRLVDAYGGDHIMWMELTFYKNTLDMVVHTSRFGELDPKKHMHFEAKRMHPYIAAKAAKKVGFPNYSVAYDFSQGLPPTNWQGEYPQTSASYMWQSEGKSIVELGKLAGDPVRIDQVPYLAQLEVNILRDSNTKESKLLVYLSDKALTNKKGKLLTRQGYIKEELWNSLLSFPELSPNDSRFNFTYLHPGDYYLTVVADKNGDGYPSSGDILSPSTKIIVAPQSHPVMQIDNLSVQN